jgi:hypothetical protein
VKLVGVGVEIFTICGSPRLERIYHRQQRRREQESPEREYKSEDERGEDRCPDRHSCYAPHDIGLEHRAIDDDNQCIKNENVEWMLPISPAKRGGKDWTEQAEDGPEVRDDLQGCCYQRPQRSPGHTDDPEAGEPEEAQCLSAEAVMRTWSVAAI